MSDGWLFKSGAHLHLLQTLEAQFSLVRALALMSATQRSSYHQQIARTLEGKKEYAAAIIQWDLALAADPKDAQAWFDKGVAYHEMGQWQRAIDSLTQSIALRANYELAWNDRGWAKANLGRWEEAIIDYTKAIDLVPTYLVAWNNRGNAHGELSRWQECAADFTRGFELRGDLSTAEGLAVAKLAIHDGEGYRKICEGLLARSGKFEDPQTANFTAWICALAPILGPLN